MDVEEAYGDAGAMDLDDRYEVATRFAQAPEDVAQSDRYTIGPIAVTTDSDDGGTLTDRDRTKLAGTEADVTVIAEDV